MEQQPQLLMGAFLVWVVLIFLVGNVRAAIITAVTIPFSLLLTFIVMQRFGVSGNLMSLGALDFGIIIDGAVIVLDHCVRTIHERAQKLGRSLTGTEVQGAVYDASIEIRTAAGFGELIIVVVFLPLFGLVGVEGKMFIPMAGTFSAAILAALVLSFTLAPALASIFLKGDATDSEPRLMKEIRSRYLTALELALSRSRKVLIGALISVAVSLLVFSFLGGEFLPRLSEGSYVFQFTRPVRISLDQSIQLQERTDELIRTFPEVENVFSRIGTSEIATDPMGVNLADTYVTLKKGANQSAELEAKMIQKLEAWIPGQRVMASQPIEMRFNELLEGTRADVTVKVFGEDLDQISELTHQISEVLETVPGSGEIEVELKGKSPVLKVAPKEGILKSLGVSAREVLDTVGIALGGEEIGYLFEGVKRFPILIRLSEELRSNLKAIEELPVGVQSSGTIPLYEVAALRFDESFASVSREQSRRRGAVMINPRGRDTESFVKEAQKQISEKIKLPPGYFLEWGGHFKNLEEAKKRLIILAPLALMAVLMMIYAAFRNVAQTLMIAVCVPLAWVGGVMGLVMNRLPFSISAGVGFIALSGIAVLNGVVLVHFFHDLEKQGRKPSEILREGTALRLRPVLMTALVDVFGFLPMMLSTGVGAEVQRPLASVVIGGVLSSTFLTLFVLPIIYREFLKRLKEVNDESSI
jgi:cobalt-zinc-cadmium resistance protein CzcA